MDLLILLKSFSKSPGLCLIVAFNIQIGHLGLQMN